MISGNSAVFRPISMYLLKGLELQNLKVVSLRWTDPFLRFIEKDIIFKDTVTSRRTALYNKTMKRFKVRTREF